VQLQCGWPGTAAVLSAGNLSPLPGTVPPCSLWIGSSFTLGSGVTDRFGMLNFVVPLQPGLVNAELGLQAGILLSGGGLRLSNALGVRIGGGL
jgi:hypothetical protein